MVAGVGEAVPCGLGILIVTWAGSLAGMSMVTWEGGGKQGVIGGLAELAGAGGAGVPRNVSSKAAISCRASCLHCTNMPLHNACNTQQIAVEWFSAVKTHTATVLTKSDKCLLLLKNCIQQGTELLSTTDCYRTPVHSGWVNSTAHSQRNTAPVTACSACLQACWQEQTC